MKKTIVAGIGLLMSLTAVAAQTPGNVADTAPFGLHWGQAMSDIRFVKPAKCGDVTGGHYCPFGKRKWMNPWNSDAALLFNEDKLTLIITSFSDDDIERDACDKTHREIAYLASLGIDITPLKDAEALCLPENTNRLMKYEKTLDTAFGTVKVKLYRASGLGIIGTTTYKSAAYQPIYVGAGN